ncbi:MAG TPA: YDG domain-containing protein [Steroidobacteraceae bacterium]|nr:YDG domain-containing protein [Steroidobacteraceae bacterium]
MRKKTFALTPLAFACKCILAQTLPTGGAIVQGQGSIASSGNTMTIKQTSQRMIADWQTFSVGSDNTVRFVQPSADAVALNRVIGGDPSRILGNLTANGRVYIQNPNGVIFGKGAQVSVGSLVATTMQANSTEFMETGRLKLSATDGAGAVSNEGTIDAAAGGHVVLAGTNVSNAGTINAPGGTIGLAAGREITIDPTGAGVVSITIPAEAVGAQIVNSGALIADGGRITVQAAAADAAASRVLQIDGVVRARSIEQHDGQIVLSGGSSGVVSVGGQLDASGSGSANGGSVKVLGDRVLLQSTAQIDASGASGGSVLIGGSFQGKGSEPNAHITAVDEGARIDASARDRGNGGEVVVWADGITSYAGNISAHGGAMSGNGGSVEVSGKHTLQFTGTVDTRAPAGKRGTLLLDPSNLEIGEDTDVNGDSTPGDDLVGTNLDYDQYDYADSEISASNVASLLATSDVTLQARSRIIVSAPVSVVAGGANSTLTLNALIVSINAPMTLNNTALNIDTQRIISDAIRINAQVTSLRWVALTSTDIGIAADVIVPSLTMTIPDEAGNGFIRQTGGSITANYVQVNARPGFVYLTQSGNTMGTLDVYAYSGAINVDFTPDGSPLRTGATIEDSYALTVAGKLVQSRSMSIGGEFDLTTGDDAILDDANNDFRGPVRFDVGGSLRLHDLNDLDAGGMAFNDIDITAGSLFTLGADIGSTNAARSSLIEISSAGFDNSADAHLDVQLGSRFIIRSSDFTRDVIGAVGFSDNYIANVNYTVLNGWVGADPTTGNGYYTNRRGTIDAPNSDRPPISRLYDRTTGFDFTQTGERANAFLEDDAAGATGLGHYRVLTNGAFENPNAGQNKRYTVAATNNVVATVAGNGSTVYGLLYESFTRPAGVVGAEGPGNLISEIIPRPVYGNGVTGIDRVYDGTNNVALDIDNATLNGVLDGDTVGLGAGNLVGTTADKNVGAGKTVATHDELVLNGADAGNYVLVDQSAPTVTITARTIFSNGATAIDREYDGTNSVALNVDGAQLDGVLTGDTVGLAPDNLVGTIADPNAGAGKPVTTHDPVALNGADAANYQLVDLSKPTVTITAPPPPPPPPARQPTMPDPQEPFRSSLGTRHVVPPASVDLAIDSLARPAVVPPLASAEPCEPTTEKEEVTDTRTFFFYFPYRSAIIDQARSAAEDSSLKRALADGFEVQRVRGFTSPEGPRAARDGFEGNDDLSLRRASAALVYLRDACSERGESCVADSVQPEAGSALHALAGDVKAQAREVDGAQLAEYAAARFNSDDSDVRQRTPEVERELEEARTPAEKAQVVYPQLRRVEIEVTRQRVVEHTKVASAVSCPVDRQLASTGTAEPAR